MFEPIDSFAVSPVDVFGRDRWIDKLWIGFDRWSVPARSALFSMILLAILRQVQAPWALWLFLECHAQASQSVSGWAPGQALDPCKDYLDTVMGIFSKNH